MNTKILGFALFLGFIIEVMFFVVAGILLFPFIIIGLAILAIGIIWAVVVGKGIEIYTLRRIKEKYNG